MVWKLDCTKERCAMCVFWWVLVLEANTIDWPHLQSLFSCWCCTGQVKQKTKKKCKHNRSRIRIESRWCIWYHRLCLATADKQNCDWYISLCKYCIYCVCRMTELIFSLLCCYLLLYPCLVLNKHFENTYFSQFAVFLAERDCLGVIANWVVFGVTTSEKLHSTYLHNGISYSAVQYPCC